MRGRGSKGTRACDLRDPWPAPTASVGARSRGEAGMGRKKTLLLGWLTRGVRLAAGAAQARRDAVKRYWLAGETRRSASARGWRGEARLTLWAACASGRVGGLGRAGSQGRAGLGCCCSLSPISFSFSIFFCIMLHFFHVYKSKWHISPLV